MSSFRFQMKDKHPQNILKDTRKLLSDKTNVSSSSKVSAMKEILVNQTDDVRI